MIDRFFVFTLYLSIPYPTTAQSYGLYVLVFVLYFILGPRSAHAHACPFRPLSTGSPLLRPAAENRRTGEP